MGPSPGVHTVLGPYRASWRIWGVWLKSWRVDEHGAEIPDAQEVPLERSRAGGPPPLLALVVLGDMEALTLTT